MTADTIARAERDIIYLIPDEDYHRDMPEKEGILWHTALQPQSEEHPVKQ
jgi:hypothetical protein